MNAKRNETTHRCQQILYATGRIMQITSVRLFTKCSCELERCLNLSQALFVWFGICAYKYDDALVLFPTRNQLKTSNRTG